MSKKKVISQVIDEAVAEAVNEIEAEKAMVVREEGLEESTSTETTQAETTVEPTSTETVEKPALKEVTVFFGKGEYSINSANIDKLIGALEKYAEDGTWRWMISDMLGLKIDGLKGKRYYEILATLNGKEDEKITKLLHLMVDFQVHPNTHRVMRATKEEKEARRAEVAEIINKIEGLTEIEKQRMLKVI